MTARIVNVNTGEILAVASGKGESTRSGTSLIGAGGGTGGAAAGALDMRSSNFADTVLGEAVNAAARKAHRVQLNASAGKLPTTIVSVDGLVADVSGQYVDHQRRQPRGRKGRRQAEGEPRWSRDPRSCDRQSNPPRDRSRSVKWQSLKWTKASAVGKFSGAGTVKVGDAVKN